ncbi:MAG TPA: TIM barrel protein, partial [Fimbriimonas sp.]|nr:TIM barrel protein [Fimbriimonas sp.]
MTDLNRREFLIGAAALGATAASGSVLATPAKPWFKLSLAEWSLNRALFGGQMTNLDFPRVAREMGFEGVEYVNQFFMDKAKDTAYLTELKKRCKDEGVKNVLIMCDGEGQTGHVDPAQRTKAVENHYKWVDAAKFLGCHSIRVNAQSTGDVQEQIKLCADGLSRIGEYAAPLGINVIVENHGGNSSKGDWLTAVMKMANMKNVGTLP